MVWTFRVVTMGMKYYTNQSPVLFVCITHLFDIKDLLSTYAPSLTSNSRHSRSHQIHKRRNFSVRIALLTLKL